MAQKKKEQEDVHLENVQEALSKSEAFIEQYRKQLVIGVAVVVAVVVADTFQHLLFGSARTRGARGFAAGCCRFRK